MTNLTLTNGAETFLLGSIESDDSGPIHGKDSRGSGYTRCDVGCDHGAVPPNATVWHDDENTETLWEC